MTNLTEEGVLALISGVVGIVALLMLFGCSSSSIMSCDNLLGEEKEACIERIKNRDNNFRYQVETMGSMR